MKKIKNSPTLLALIFLGVPLILTIIIILFFKTTLEAEIVMQTISLSGTLFGLSSLIIVIILLKSFKPSDYHRSVSSKTYLENDAIEELKNSLEKIYECINTNEVRGLSKSSANIKHIYQTLKEHEEDVRLQAYEYKLKKVVNLINKYRLSSIGFDENYVKLRETPVKVKIEITQAIYDLKENLERTRS